MVAVETKVLQLGSLGKHSIAPGLKKRKRLETPPEQIASGDEARYVEQEQKADKGVEDDDPDYKNTSMKSTSSD